MFSPGEAVDDKENRIKITASIFVKKINNDIRFDIIGSSI